jgi:hypothetical protein
LSASSVTGTTSRWHCSRNDLNGHFLKFRDVVICHLFRWIHWINNILAIAVAYGTGHHSCSVHAGLQEPHWREGGPKSSSHSAPQALCGHREMPLFRKWGVLAQVTQKPSIGRGSIEGSFPPISAIIVILYMLIITDYTILSIFENKQIGNSSLKKSQWDYSNLLLNVIRPGVVVHICNPSYLGGRGRRITEARPGNSIDRYLKNKLKARGLGA